MKIFILIFSLQLSALSFSNTYSTHEEDGVNCIFSHLKDAIKSNSRRQKMYSKYTSKESAKLVRKLIGYETLMLTPSLILDQFAKKYQRKGIPIFCKDLIKMNNLDEFRAFDFIPYVQYHEAFKPNIKLIQTEISSQLRKKTYQSLKLTLESTITKMFVYKEYNCITRHFLESITRSLALLPTYIKQAKLLGYQSPEGLMIFYLNFQAKLLGSTMKLDKEASHYQESGIPLFCQDLPFIPIK